MKCSVAIASGKGGVGKSLVAYCIAKLLARKKKVAIIDADTLGSLKYYFAINKFDKRIAVESSERASVRKNWKQFVKKRGIKIENLVKVCPFNAIKYERGKLQVDQILCEGCYKCQFYYPEIFKIEKVKNGEIVLREVNKNITYIGINLFPSEKASGKIVYEAIEYSDKFPWDLRIIDCPASLHCETIASLQNSNFAIAVVEPSIPSLMYFVELLKLIKKMNIEYGIVINKVGMNNKIEKRFFKKYKERIIGKVHFSNEIPKLLNEGRDILSLKELKEEVKEIISNLENCNLENS